MTTMRTLKRQARKSATLRGHTLARFHHFSDDTARAHCVNCPCDVQVERFPAPNSIDIGGSAVAVQCEPANWRRLDPHYSGSLAAYVAGESTLTGDMPLASDRTFPTPYVQVALAWIEERTNCHDVALLA